MKKYLLLNTVLCLLLISCSSSKNITYFQDIEKSIHGQLDNKGFTKSLTIKKDDELSIIVSAEDPQVAMPFNLPIVSVPNSYIIGSEPRIGQQMNQAQALQTYFVDTNGDINFPILGKIRVVGMTKDEATNYLEDKLRKYIKEPIVNIRILSFRVSVLGEVNAPGTFTYNGQRVSVLDAIASAKDLTIHGQRNNAVIIREIDGKKEFFKIDLTKTEMFSSPNYYLEQNDIVYVLPNKEKQRDANSGLQKQFNLTVITAAISSLISVFAILSRR